MGYWQDDTDADDKKELQKREYKEDILVVWFDAWRYENEKYLTIVPLIRSIKIAIDNKIYEDSKEKGRVNNSLRELGKGFTKVLDGLAKSVSLNASSFEVGAELDGEKFTNIVGSEGSVTIDGEQVYYRKQHMTEQLEKCFKKFIDGRDRRRIVIFVDDLDH
jgi:hypothetical protein